MSDHSDMRRRAAQHASYGNYWAGKCVGLLDEIARLQEAERLKTANERAMVADDSDEVDPEYLRSLTGEGDSDD